jgi:EAL and modified HD-GYP domain-containing signal transduction protein
MSDIYLARQPIFDAAQQVVGYEILHRSGPENVFIPIDTDVASSSSVDRAAMSVGLDPLTDGKLAFVNVSRRVLLEEIYALLPARRTVLELLENVAPDREVLEACRRVKSHGFRLALDDFNGAPELAELLDLADIVKIDVQQPISERAFEMSAPHLQRGLKLIAEKVETAAMHRSALDRGYHFFQGYFYCRPEMVQTRDVSPSKLNALRFLAEVCREDASFERLERVFRKDVSLSTRLLRYLNSAGFGWRHEITSLDHALRLVGLWQLQKWGAMMGVVTISTDRPQELAVTALSRARFAEQLGQVMGEAGRELDYFLVGLLSLLDAMIGRPLREVLSGMAVSEPVRDALLGADSHLGGTLHAVTAYERGDWYTVERFLVDHDVKSRQAHDAYASSLTWARQAAAY